jgi:EmrB/QacA subfamily drug resistance transporter
MAQQSQFSPKAVLLSVSLGQFMVPMMFTSVGVGLPSMGRELGATAAQLGLVEQLYALSLAMSMLTFGRLGDVIGRRKVFLWGLVVFTVMTATLGFAQSIVSLIVQRFIQGLGAAMLLSGSMALVSDAFPVSVRGRMIGIVSAVTYAGLTLGPLCGGAITSSLGWRYVFWLVVPLGLTAWTACLTRMRGEPGELSRERMDWRGSAVYAAGVAAFMLGAAHAGEGPVSSALILAGLAGLALFVVLERRTKAPLLDMALITKNRFFSLSCLAALGMYASAFGVTFFMSLYLQYARGLSPREAGLVLLIQPLMQFIVSPAAGRLSDKTSPVKLANIGMLLCTAGLVSCAWSVSPATSLYMAAVELALVGLGTGLFVTPNVVAIMASVEPRQFGVASGMIGTARTLGLVVSMTTATLVFSLVMSGEAVSPATLPGFMTSMRASLAVFALYSCMGMLLSLGRGKADAPPLAGG